jgi:hypothetical protein
LSLSTSQIGGENFKFEESSGQGCGWLGQESSGQGCGWLGLEYDSGQIIEG